MFSGGCLSWALPIPTHDSASRALIFIFLCPMSFVLGLGAHPWRVLHVGKEATAGCAHHDAKVMEAVLLEQLRCIRRVHEGALLPVWQPAAARLPDGNVPAVGAVPRAMPAARAASVTRRCLTCLGLVWGTMGSKSVVALYR